jgi:hypothetical protein
MALITRGSISFHHIAHLFFLVAEFEADSHPDRRQDRANRAGGRRDLGGQVARPVFLFGLLPYRAFGDAVLCGKCSQREDAGSVVALYRFPIDYPLAAVARWLCGGQLFFLAQVCSFLFKQSLEYCV